MAREILKSDFPSYASFRVAYTPERDVFLAFVDWEEEDGMSNESYFELRPLLVV
jgi:hypothetical protein